jgi:DNA replication protein DnaC
LRKLSNEEFERAEAMAKTTGTPLSQCPTCLSTEQTVSPTSYGREYGTYKFRGETYDCNCDEQIQLRKHYLVANIPTQYQQLDFREYSGDSDIKEAIADYLGHWPTVKAAGIGIEFTSPRLGTGKTFCATFVGKELVKKGEAVYFAQFREVLNAYEKENGNGLEAKMMNTTVLILDELIPPWTQKQGHFFAEKFETLIRHRTNFNLPTIMTTNLTEEELAETYPRPYSLLSAKQTRIVIDGDDYRLANLGMENVELAMNGEVRPIT